MVPGIPAVGRLRLRPAGPQAGRRDLPSAHGGYRCDRWGKGEPRAATRVLAAEWVRPVCARLHRPARSVHHRLHQWNRKRWLRRADWAEFGDLPPHGKTQGLPLERRATPGDQRSAHRRLESTGRVHRRVRAAALECRRRPCPAPCPLSKRVGGEPGHLDDSRSRSRPGRRRDPESRRPAAAGFRRGARCGRGHLHATPVALS